MIDSALGALSALPDSTDVPVDDDIQVWITELLEGETQPSQDEARRISSRALKRDARYALVAEYTIEEAVETWSWVEFTDEDADTPDRLGRELLDSVLDNPDVCNYYYP